jgi:competence protein ComFC
MATAMAPQILDLDRARSIDLITWAPTTSERVRERGFDHGELLAREVGRLLGRPVVSTLMRASNAVSLGSADERARVAFSARTPRRGPSLRGSRVLVVDDVRTTGATLSAAARALRLAGVAHVDAATFAATSIADRAPLTTADRRRQRARID